MDYGIKISQEEIASNLTPSEKGFFVDNDKVRNFFSKNGFEYKSYWINETPFNEPDFLLQVISENNGFFGIKDHTYKILKFKDPTIFSLDPKDGTLKKFELCKLRRKTEVIFGLVKKL